MKKKIYDNLIVIVLVAISFQVFASEPIVVLDSGHDPIHRGAKAVCGKYEVEYNDSLVSFIVEDKRIASILTRYKNRPPNSILSSSYGVIDSLRARVAAVPADALLFISIHHDSVAERYIEFDDKLCFGAGGRKINQNFKSQFSIGFNIFVYDDGSDRYRKSLAFAKIISAKLLELGRNPSNYHFPEFDDCKSCRPVYADLGIWHQNLYVLRENPSPAVLIEIGNIIDVDDENVSSSVDFKKSFARILVDGILKFADLLKK
jgi:hypothetical protein